MINTTEQVKVRRDGNVGTVLLDHPARLNALTPGMIEGILQGLEDLHTDGRVRSVVLTGNGSSFCSGTDLNTIRFAGGDELPPSDWNDIDATRELLEYMLRFPRPLLAAVSGWTVGTGLALMLCCDVVIAASNARFRVAEPALGLSPGLTAPLLVRRIGAGRAAGVLTGAFPVPAEAALAMGLVDEVQPPDLVWARACQWGAAIAEGAAESLQLTRQLVNDAIGESLFTWLNIGAAQVATARTTAAAMERVARFLAASGNSDRENPGCEETTG